MIQRGDLVVVIRSDCRCHDADADYGLIFEVRHIEPANDGLVCQGCGLEVMEPGIEHPVLGPGSFIPISWVKKLDGMSPMERIEAVLELCTDRALTSTDAEKIHGWLRDGPPKLYGFDCAGRIKRA